jgi:putative tricarboxylic transport membrane protein
MSRSRGVPRLPPPSPPHAFAPLTAEARDRIKAASVGVAFLLLGIGVCVEALQVPLGSVRMPGAGFFPLLLGIALSLLAILLLGMTAAHPPGEWRRVWPERPEVLYLIASLAAGVALFERLGFLVTMTAFLAVALKVLGRMSWPSAAVLALVGSVASYLVFSRALLIALPTGILPY